MCTPREGYAQGLRIAANTGTENSRGTLGINVNANHSGTGYLHGIDIDANHYGTTGEAHGVDIYLTGSDTGDVKGVHAESRKIRQRYRRAPPLALISSATATALTAVPMASSGKP